MLLGLYEFAASLKLAVILIFLAAAVLGWGTFVESAYGTPAVHFGFWGTWWFVLINALLALNIFCAAAIRYPWKRHQTGFVITHLGLLTLLLGCWLGHRGGVDAQMTIFEGTDNHVAVKDTQQIEVAVHRGSQTTADDVELLPPIPFHGGPFNWDKFDQQSWLPATEHLARDVGSNKLFWFPWSLARRDQGVLYDRDGVRIEALDYYADSQEVVFPRVSLRLSLPRRTIVGPDGKPKREDYRYMPVDVQVWDEWPGTTQRAFGARPPLGGGGMITFGMTRVAAEAEHFLDSAPQGPLGQMGRVVLHAAGQKFDLALDDIIHADSTPLGETGLSLRVANYDPQFPRVTLDIRGPEKSASMILYADVPEFNVPDDEHGVYGSYWVDQGDLTTQQKMAGMGKSRIDILQGPDLVLRYRYFNGHKVLAAGILPDDSTPIDAFQMPADTLKLYVARHDKSDRPLRTVLPKPFDKESRPVIANRAVRLRVTVDGQQDEFWLVGPGVELVPISDVTVPDPQTLTLPWYQLWQQARFPSQGRSRLDQHTVQGQGRRLALRFPLQQEVLGFKIHLERFKRLMDPGTRQDAEYASIIRPLDIETGKPLRDQELTISMNAPIDFRDPKSGKSYRLFQEAFHGPFRPDDNTGIYQQFYRLNPHLPRRPTVAITVLTVNYDPGRGVKYAGCLLVVVGIAVMFYMRAYFFKPRQPAAAAPAQKPAAAPPARRQLVGSAPRK